VNLKAVLAGVCLCFASSAAFAQEAPSLRAHHVTLGGSLVWSGGYDIGEATAQLRGNGAGASSTPFNWFTTRARIAPAVAPELHVGVALTPTIAIDGGVAYAKPRIAFSIERDAEMPSASFDGEKIEQYQIGAGVSWQLPVHFRGRAAPFVSAGASYLRQLHEDRGLAETGQIYHAGGGVRYWLTGGHGSSRATGVRVDGRLNLRKDGIDFENKMRAYPTVTFSFFVGL
jgi:hypothetical protein